MPESKVVPMGMQLRCLGGMSKLATVGNNGSSMGILPFTFYFARLDGFPFFIGLVL